MKEKVSVADEGAVMLNDEPVALLGSGNWHRHWAQRDGQQFQVAHDVIDENCEHPEALLGVASEDPKGPDDSWPERVETESVAAREEGEVKGPDPDVWG